MPTDPPTDTTPEPSATGPNPGPATGESPDSMPPSQDPFQDRDIAKLWTAYGRMEERLDEWRLGVDTRIQDFHQIFEVLAEDRRDCQQLRLEVERLKTWMTFVKIIGMGLWAMTLVIAAAVLRLVFEV